MELLVSCDKKKGQNGLLSNSHCKLVPMQYLSLFVYLQNYCSSVSANTIFFCHVSAEKSKLTFVMWSLFRFTPLGPLGRLGYVEVPMEVPKGPGQWKLFQKALKQTALRLFGELLQYRCTLCKEQLFLIFATRWRQMLVIFRLQPGHVICVHLIFEALKPYYFLN